jgi:hypothetical protein
MAPIQSWRIPLVVNSPEKIQLARLSHVFVSHPNLDEFDKFARDFGFVEEAREDETIYYRGYGRDVCSYVATRSADGEKHFDGAAYLAKTEQDFLKAAGMKGSSPVTDNSGPCGGRRVTLLSPSGTKIHILWGVNERPAPEKAVSATEVHKGGYNTALEKHRKGMSFVSVPGDVLCIVCINSCGRLQESSNGSSSAQQWCTSSVTTVTLPPSSRTTCCFTRKTSTLLRQTFSGRIWRARRWIP